MDILRNRVRGSVGHHDVDIMTAKRNPYICHTCEYWTTPHATHHILETPCYCRRCRNPDEYELFMARVSNCRWTPTGINTGHEAVLRRGVE
ncbi:hypothetical protein LCGC14_0919920 [marine sediment metagenome]|uniref:Uncharacterized protein n=1 Tax=marine sediment metagenome TaxID=412755 RepID=A0A0F9PBT3_9ZZZZ